MNNPALHIPYLPAIDEQSTLSVISVRLDTLPQQVIAQVPWADYPYQPTASFSIGHTNDHIAIKYAVQEKVVKGACYTSNSPVYTDSCVEFFIAPENSRGYYNLEFNCIGTCLAGYGEGRTDRTPVPAPIIKTIRYQAVLQNDTQAATVHWGLTLLIPVQVFCFHHISSLQGMHCSGNFYKCGDDLPEPHFLSWMPIQTPQPDFHRPGFFGSLYFE
jgi:hypothetical protein